MSREKAQARSTGIPVRASAARANLFPTPASGSEVASPKISNRIVNENAAICDIAASAAAASGNGTKANQENESSSSDDEVNSLVPFVTWKFYFVCLCN